MKIFVSQWKKVSNINISGVASYEGSKIYSSAVIFQEELPLGWTSEENSG